MELKLKFSSSPDRIKILFCLPLNSAAGPEVVKALTAEKVEEVGVLAGVVEGNHLHAISLTVRLGLSPGHGLGAIAVPGENVFSAQMVLNVATRSGSGGTPGGRGSLGSPEERGGLGAGRGPAELKSPGGTEPGGAEGGEGTAGAAPELGDGDSDEEGQESDLEGHVGDLKDLSQMKTSERASPFICKPRGVYHGSRPGPVFTHLAI